VIMVSFLIGKRTAETQAPSAQTSPGTPEAMFANYQDFKWKKILPDLGDSSPEISILQVDPQTQATKLVIRTPKGIHIRKHWHSANETHTVILGNQVFELQRIEQGPGWFYRDGSSTTSTPTGSIPPGSTPACAGGLTCTRESASRRPNRLSLRA
jgi:hypothetical protein